MGLEQYLVPQQRGNICFDCANACGGCPWTAVDPVTNKIRFEPVPGWTAKKRTFVVGRNRGGRKTWVETYAIENCPLERKRA